MAGGALNLTTGKLFVTLQVLLAFGTGKLEVTHKWLQMLDHRQALCNRGL
jgi:hypothetical protein